MLQLLAYLLKQPNGNDRMAGCGSARLRQKSRVADKIYAHIKVRSVCSFYAKIFFTTLIN